MAIPGASLVLLSLPLANPPGFSGPAFGSLGAQDADSIRRQLDKLRDNPVYRRLLEGQKKPALTAAQRRLMEDAVKGLNDKQVLEYLKVFRLSTAGSVYTRRERLRVALGIAEKPKLPRKKAAPRISIESASEGEYFQGKDDKRGLLKLRGRIRVRIPQGVFEADRVVVDVNRREIYAEGNLVYRSNKGVVKAERIIYNQDLNIGIMYNAKGFQDPVHFIGRNLTQIGPKRFALSHVRFTTSGADPPHYHFSARKVWISSGGRLVAVGVLYHVGGIPLLPLPFFYSSPWGTGIIAQAGWSQLRGAFLQNTYQFSVPEASLSAWMPVAYRFTLDYYQYTGEVAGAEMFKFSPAVNYIIQLGAARYKRYEIASDFRQTNRIRVTNTIRRADGTVGSDFDRWFKIFTLFNFKHADFKRNHVRNINIRYDNYKNHLYEYEFGGRTIPETTIPALFENSEGSRGLVRDTTDWNLTYNEQWDDLSVRVTASRVRLWQEQSDFRNSRYIPVSDVAPSVDVRKRFDLGRVPLWDGPLYWVHDIHSDLTKIYSNGKIFQSLNKNVYSNRLLTSMSFYPWITFQPSVGYEARRVSVQDGDDALKREAQKGSYQAWTTEDTLIFGPDYLFLRGTYRQKKSFKQELSDAPQVNLTGFENNQVVNETEVAIETRPMRDLRIALTSVYDHRRFQFEIFEDNRWYYPVLRVDWLIDFLNWGRPGRENLLSRRRLHFLKLRVTNDYVRDTVRGRDHSNVLGLNFQMGGFELPLLKRLRFLETGFYWYHVYYNQELDHMRFSVKADLQLTKYLFLEFQLESRAVDIERYDNRSVDATGVNDSVSFEQDVINGTGLAGARARQETVFNIGYFETALIMDLDEWEYRIGVSIEQKQITAGVNSLEVVTFYDRKVFMSMTLLRFDIAGTADRPSRFLINRGRVRTADIGRTSVNFN